MDRKEIKELAKAKIKGNLWKLLWPILSISIVGTTLLSIITPSTMKTTNMLEYTEVSMPKVSPVQLILVILISVIFSILTVAYKKYVLNFVRTGKCEFKDILECMKAKWLNILLATILVGILVGLASILLVIPGIILTYAYAMVSYLVIDTDLDAISSMKESRRMMKGYKFDYFVFALSFIGWGFLAGLTFGILFIWLLPYIMVADAIYYDKLKEKTK